ncbi:MAG: galactokinase, partial [[Eubacterium] siraeum]|nr:galactokinase [[Eubacterium] siraeum]
YLQNVFTVNDIKNQALGIGLNVSDSVLNGKGACRVHGGGFAGTVQAFVPIEMLKEFMLALDTVFGNGSCHVMRIRKIGGAEVALDS